jgi:hypothetical protein
MGVRLVVALAAAAIVPACNKEETVVGTPGEQGPPGPSGANPPAQWADPVNLSQQAATWGYDAYGQQAAFTPDGRMHVVYFAYDYDSDEDQLFYTSAPAPYTDWDAPVIVTSDDDGWYSSPQGFDIAAGSDNSANVVYSRNRYCGSYNVVAVAANGVYTTDVNPPSCLSVGAWVYFYNLANSANNGYFRITALGLNTITVNNPASVVEATAAGYWQSYTTELRYARNASSARGTFADSLVYDEYYDTTSIYSGRLLMRGAVAHIVWTGYNSDVMDYGFYYGYANSTQAWPVSTAAIMTEEPENYVGNEHYAFVSDAAGNFHLAYYLFYYSSYGPRMVAYRSLPTTASSFSTGQVVSDIADDYTVWNSGPPIVQFDGSNNVYVFWKRWDTDSGTWPGRAILCNIKTPYGSFNGLNRAVVTVDPSGEQGWLDNNTVMSGDYLPIFDVQVAADGRIHAAWREEVYNYSTSYTLYPIVYRTKDPGTNPQSGWQEAQFVAYANSYDGGYGNDLVGGGMNRSVLVRADGDGNPHVFWANRVTAEAYDYGYGTYSYDAAFDLMHSYLPAGGTTWYSGGNTMAQSNVALHNGRTYAYNYFLEAGVEEDGSPFVLSATDPNTLGLPFMMTDYTNFDLVYTHRWAGEWQVGVDVNGPDQPEVYGFFWAGRDPEGKLHLLWQQEADPFLPSGMIYDVMHSNSPVVSGSTWNTKVSEARYVYPSSPWGP